jgi:hypothetical protein
MMSEWLYEPVVWSDSWRRGEWVGQRIMRIDKETT